MILTEYTLEGTTIAEMNKKFEKLFIDPKWTKYEDLTEERLQELKAKFPFMEKKDGLLEREEKQDDAFDQIKEPEVEK